ncbi:hypothetical protein GCM10023318_48300 [Nocardia callitridis]|uniref:Uncharacterized protein n=1 Tax=Nocardia callitridis TaxID=648753 RepID=A0ABP9KT11_9NOCA
MSTVARAENPVSGTAPPSPNTLKQLDLALRWTEGSAAKALHGGVPLELAEPTVEARSAQRSSITDERDPLSFRVVEVDISVVDALIAAADRAFELCDRVDLPAAAQESASSVREQLGRAVGRLVAAQATEVLERAGGPENELPRNIERLIGALLATSPTASGAERGDQQYRRWLARRATDLPPELEACFRRRFRSKLDRINSTEGEDW